VKVTAWCDQCLAKSRFDASRPPAALKCPKCGGIHILNPTDSVRSENRLDRCPVCASGYFYREKDFNAWAGGAVIVAAIIGFIIMAERNITIALGILLAAAALDLIVYALVPFRYVCYKCLASMHGAERNPAIGPYDLGTAGRFADDYDQERDGNRK
jgi:hypothetical protein